MLQAGMLHGALVTTVEGLPGNPHPLQARLAQCHGVQCGYDAPGVVMSMFSLLLGDQPPSMEDIKQGLAGNLSRCTGYRAWLTAFAPFTKDSAVEKKNFEKSLPKELMIDNVSIPSEWGLALVPGDGAVTVKGAGLVVEESCTLTNLLTSLKEMERTQGGLVDALASAVESIKSLQYRNVTCWGEARKLPELRVLEDAVGKDGQLVNPGGGVWWGRVANRRGNARSEVCAVLTFASGGSHTIVLWPADQEGGVEKITGSLLLRKQNGEVEGQGITGSLARGLVGRLVASTRKEEREEMRVDEEEGQVATQISEFPNQATEGISPLGLSVPHTGALLCAKGEAQFIDDIPSVGKELFMAFVLSDCASGILIDGVDASSALSIPNVTHCLTSANVPVGKNRFAGSMDALEDVIFVEDEVQHHGQAVAAVLAEDRETARKAASRVKVSYQEQQALVTIEQAATGEAFNPRPTILPFSVGDVDEALAVAKDVVEGEFKTPRQEHFYEETMCCLAVPEENNQMKLFCPAPSPLMLQYCVANLLEVPLSRVTVVTRRIGCNFGAKQVYSLSLAMAVALAAKVTGRPVRTVLERGEDIQRSGQRGEFQASWRAGLNSGKITGVELKLQKNGGWNIGCSPDILTRCLIASSNCYQWASMLATGDTLRTNTPSNTAFRAYGSPPAFAITENMIFDICAELNLDPIEFRRRHFRKIGDVTHYGQELREDDCTVEECFDECITKSNYYNQLKAVEDWNREHKHKKRGISLLPFSYGVGGAIGQAGALVNVHLDGSVVISIGGVELGQGLFTKMAQVASHELGAPLDCITVAESSTERVPNPNLTGGSSTADYCGGAVRDACLQLNSRLAPVKASQPEIGWKGWIFVAWNSKVNLSVAGHFTARKEWSNYDKEQKKGNKFTYFVSGAACSIVEVDTLTGEHRLLSAHVVMDIGESLNPAIDIGQIEGAFMQGYGYLCMEDTLFSEQGHLLSTGHDTYTIPSIKDLPPIFNVSLLRKATPLENRRVLYSSKGVGEPPFLAGETAFFAVKAAVLAAREEVGKKGGGNLKAPAVPSNVIAAIGRS